MLLLIFVCLWFTTVASEISEINGMILIPQTIQHVEEDYTVRTELILQLKDQISLFCEISLQYDGFPLLRSLCYPYPDIGRFCMTIGVECNQTRIVWMKRFIGAIMLGAAVTGALAYLTIRLETHINHMADIRGDVAANTKALVDMIPALNQLINDMKVQNDNNRLMEQSLRSLRVYMDNNVEVLFKQSKIHNAQIELIRGELILSEYSRGIEAEVNAIKQVSRFRSQSGLRKLYRHLSQESLPEQSVITHVKQVHKHTGLYQFRFYIVHLTGLVFIRRIDHFVPRRISTTEYILRTPISYSTHDGLRYREVSDQCYQFGGYSICPHSWIQNFFHDNSSQQINITGCEILYGSTVSFIIAGNCLLVFSKGETHHTVSVQGGLVISNLDHNMTINDKMVYSTLTHKHSWPVHLQYYVGTKLLRFKLPLNSSWQRIRTPILPHLRKLNLPSAISYHPNQRVDWVTWVVRGVLIMHTFLLFYLYHRMTKIQ